MPQLVCRVSYRAVTHYTRCEDVGNIGANEGVHAKIVSQWADRRGLEGRAGLSLTTRACTPNEGCISIFWPGRILSGGPQFLRAAVEGAANNLECTR
jgi:hypothetical protein